MSRAMNHNRPAAERKPWYRMEAAENRTAEIFIYDEIGGWFGVEASQFARELANLDVENIDLRVNSPGGDVYDGVAIMNALRRHKARVVATVDGLAASAASFIIMAADEIVMGRGAEVMIHDAWSGLFGNAEELRAEAGHLDRISNTIAALYAERAGGGVEEWRAAMQTESWYSADEAVAAHLADRVDSGTEAKAGASAFESLSRFAHARRSEAPTPWIPAAAARSRGNVGRAAATLAKILTESPNKPPAEPAETPIPSTERNDTMSDALIQGLRERLGINAEATLTEDELLAAVDEALEEQDEENTGDPETTAAAAAPAPGTVVLDEAQHTELVNAANEGRAARQRQLADDRTALVSAAVNDGRIAPARRQHWETALAADPGAAATLAGLAKGLVPIVANGYTGGVNESSDEDALYSKFYKEGK